MERKIGEVFEYEGTTLQVVEHELCEGCYFADGKECRQDLESARIIGFCRVRYDGKKVIFKKV